MNDFYVANIPGSGQCRILAKCKLQEEERCPKEGDEDGVDEEEGKASLADDHHGERPEGMEGDGERPASEKVVRPSRPLLVLLQVFIVSILMIVGYTGY